MDAKETKRTIRTFGWAAFLHDVGSDMIYPIWPIFVTETLGINKSVLGLIDGLGDAIVSISQAASGYLSDKIQKRKVFIWLGYALGGLSRIGYAITTGWQGLLLFRIMDRSGKMRGAPRDAVVADLSAQHERGKNFGFIRAMDNLGAVVGIIFSIILLNFVGYKTLFLIAAIPSALSVFLILSFTRDAKNGKRVFRGLHFKNFDRRFAYFAAVSGFFALGSFSYSFLLLYAKAGGFQVISLPLLYLLFTAIASLTSLPFGKLADKIGRKKVLLSAYLLWGLTAGALILFQNMWFVILAFVLYGVHKGALEPAQQAFASDLAPPELRASGLGGLQMIVGFCALPASLLAGVLWDGTGMHTPLIASLVFTIISIIMLFFVREEKSS